MTARRPITAAVLTALLATTAAGAACADPPAPPPPAPGIPLPTPHAPALPLFPRGQNNKDGGDSEVPIQPAKTGTPDWNKFGGDPADAPHDLNSFVISVLGWMRTAALLAGLLGLVTIGGMLAVGLRWRSEQSRRALESLPAVLLATVISGSAATILTMVL
jgi:hypothetical protein